MKGKARLRLRRHQAMAHIVKNRRACADCGSTSNLTFDHLDPAEKSFTIGNVTHERHFVGRRKLQREIEKCDVVCDRCHRRREKQRKKLGDRLTVGQRALNP